MEFLLVVACVLLWAIYVRLAEVVNELKVIRKVAELEADQATAFRADMLGEMHRLTMDVEAINSVADSHYRAFLRPPYQKY